MRGLSLVVESGHYRLVGGCSHCGGLSGCGHGSRCGRQSSQLLGSVVAACGLRSTGSVVVVRRHS